VTAFLDLVVEALNLMHPRFAMGNGTDSFRLEFYHCFRRLWDKALPVKLGLGHVLLAAEPDTKGLYFQRLGENGQEDRHLGAVLFGEPVAVDGYPEVVWVTLDASTSPPNGVTRVVFDTERWAASVG
jgi:hypothetical protein